MITLTNVKRTGDIISANYQYSGEKDYGYIEYDVKLGKYVKVIYCESDAKYDGLYTFPKIMNLIKDMIKYDNYPETCHYYWY